QRLYTSHHSLLSLRFPTLRNLLSWVLAEQAFQQHREYGGVSLARFGEVLDVLLRRPPSISLLLGQARLFPWISAAGVIDVGSSCAPRPTPPPPAGLVSPCCCAKRSPSRTRRQPDVCSHG